MSNKNIKLFVTGMHCAACELLVEKKIAKSGLARSAKASLNSQQVVLETKSETNTRDLISKLNETLKEDGYQVSENKPGKKIDTIELIKAFLLALSLVLLFNVLQKLLNLDFLGSDELSLPSVFVIGIIASLSTCMAVVGGLVLSISGQYTKKSEAKRPLIAFHIARIVGFFALGGLMGAIGSLFNPTPLFYLVLNSLLFIVMLVMGLNLLDIHPVFSSLQLRMPKALGTKILNTKMVAGLITPILLGVATFFLPCGFTQSMQFSAMTSGDILQGALIMGVFALGTLPALGAISFTSTKLAKTENSGLFFKTAGFLVLLMAIFNFYSALIAAGVIKPLF